MRHLNLIAMTAVAAAILGANAFAAELAVPPLAKPKEMSVQQNQMNCVRWTDECVNCTRGADGAAPTCSNIGFACQPKAIRCLDADVPQSEPRK
jgi:hypothetical protein